MPTPRKSTKKKQAMKAAPQPSTRTKTHGAKPAPKPRKKASAKSTDGAIPAAQAAVKAPVIKKTTPSEKKPAKPRKSSVDPELLKTIREALVHQRNQLKSVVLNTQAQMATKAVDLADVSDRASGGFEDELAMGLMAIEAGQIDEIEAAIARIDEGTYGLCVDCERAIPRKRLEVLPFALRCLNCEALKERRALLQSRTEEEED